MKDILIQKKDDLKMAIKYQRNQISYKELFNQISMNVNLLKEYGIISNNMGIFLPNSIQYAIAYFSITFSGGVIVPISIQAKKGEIISTIEYCALNLIITNTQHSDVLKSFLVNFEYKINIYNMDNKQLYRWGKNSQEFDIIDYSNQEIAENNVAIMLHTSGTTSNPKRIMLTHKNLLSNVKSNIKSLQLTKNDRTLIALPMFFGYCNTAQFLTHLYLGASIVILDTMRHPAVKEVCVIGKKHELMGEVPVAKIIVKDNITRLNEGDLKNYCLENLANYKVSDMIEFVSELPKTITGKIRRY